MKYSYLGTLSSPNYRDFEKCRYCALWNVNTSQCAIGGKDGKCKSNDTSLFESFRLNPFTAIIAAKNYEITVTDVLNLIEACANTKKGG